MTSYERFRPLLLAEQARLEKELTSIALPDPNLPGDWDAKFPEKETGNPDYSSGAAEEQADRIEEFEVNVAEERALESRLAEVRRAIERIETGTYGICKACAKPISEERLEANPAAEFDMEHQPRE